MYTPKLAMYNVEYVSVATSKPYTNKMKTENRVEDLILFVKKVKI